MSLKLCYAISKENSIVHKAFVHASVL